MRTSGSQNPAAHCIHTVHLYFTYPHAGDFWREAYPTVFKELRGTGYTLSVYCQTSPLCLSKLTSSVYLRPCANVAVGSVTDNDRCKAEYHFESL